MGRERLARKPCCAVFRCQGRSRLVPTRLWRRPSDFVTQMPTLARPHKSEPWLLRENAIALSYAKGS